MDCDFSVLLLHAQLTYQNGEKQLVLQPLKGQIDPEGCDYTVGKVKVEVRLKKMAATRWSALVSDIPDGMRNNFLYATLIAANQVLADNTFIPTPTMTSVKPKKNWATISDAILESEPEKTPDQDANVGGDSTVNTFFQKIFADADEDTKKAMLKSYTESGGTTLSTNWDEVRKGTVEVKPPAGSEWKQWG